MKNILLVVGNVVVGSVHLELKGDTLRLTVKRGEDSGTAPVAKTPPDVNPDRPLRFMARVEKSKFIRDYAEAVDLTTGIRWKLNASDVRHLNDGSEWLFEANPDDQFAYPVR